MNTEACVCVCVRDVQDGDKRNDGQVKMQKEGKRDQKKRERGTNLRSYSESFIRVLFSSKGKL